MKYAIKLTRPGINAPGHLHISRKRFTWDSDRSTHAEFNSREEAIDYVVEARKLLVKEGQVFEVVERPQSVMDKVIFAQVG